MTIVMVMEGFECGDLEEVELSSGARKPTSWAILISFYLYFIFFKDKTLYIKKL